MKSTIAVNMTDFRLRTSRVVDEVYKKGNDVVIVRNGEPIAVVVGYDSYMKQKRVKRKPVYLTPIENLPSADEEMARRIAEAKERVKMHAGLIESKKSQNIHPEKAETSPMDDASIMMSKEDDPSVFNRAKSATKHQ
jgi:prevent-host-death family protein